MKKVMLTTLALVTAVTMLAGCGASGTTTETETATEETAETQVSAEETTEEADTETVTEEVTTEEEISEEATTEEETTEEADDIEITEISPLQKMYVQDTVNVREGPSIKDKKVTSYEPNDYALISGETSDGWYRFRYKGQVVYAKASYFAEDPLSEEELAKLEEEKAAEAEATAQTQTTQTTQATATAPTAKQTAGVIMIGDSRCVQMQEATGGGGVSWICENSKGYDWMVSTAIPRAENIIGKGTKVVICLGVNDTGHANDYVAMINQKAAEWAARGAKTYFVSVNPVWENPYTTEEQVENFNATVAPALSGVRYIDTCTTLINTGYHSVDGLHYTTEDNIRIFNMIIGSL